MSVPCVHHRFVPSRVDQVLTLQRLEVVDTARCVKPVTFMSNMLCLGPEKHRGWNKKTNQSMGMLEKYSGCWSRCCFPFFLNFHLPANWETCIVAVQLRNISVVNSMSASTSLKNPAHQVCLQHFVQDQAAWPLGF